jgi:hypothetical protein
MVFEKDAKFEYNIRQKRELVTSVGADNMGFMRNWLNELGEAGELVVGNLQETGEPSGISAANGQQIPYYVITVLTVRIKPDEEVKPEGGSA